MHKAGEKGGSQISFLLEYRIHLTFHSPRLGLGATGRRQASSPGSGWETEVRGYLVTGRGCRTFCFLKGLEHSWLYPSFHTGAG